MVGPKLYHLKHTRHFMQGFKDPQHVLQTLSHWLAKHDFKYKLKSKTYSRGRKRGLHVNHIGKFKLHVNQTSSHTYVVTFDYYCKVKLGSAVVVGVLSAGISTAVGVGTLACNLADADSFVDSFWRYADTLAINPAIIVSVERWANDGKGNLVLSAPVAVQPVAVQPVIVQPVAVQPVAVQPVAVQQPPAQPAYNPAYGAPPGAYPPQQYAPPPQYNPNYGPYSYAPHPPPQQAYAPQPPPSYSPQQQPYSPQQQPPSYAQQPQYSPQPQYAPQPQYSPQPPAYNTQNSSSSLYPTMSPRDATLPRQSSQSLPSQSPQYAQDFNLSPQHQYPQYSKSPPPYAP